MFNLILVTTNKVGKACPVIEEETLDITET